MSLTRVKLSNIHSFLLSSISEKKTCDVEAIKEVTATLEQKKGLNHELVRENNPPSKRQTSEKKSEV